MPQSDGASVREPPMATIDYEAEYNNRALVPEHAEIFARWTRDAEFYRADRLKRGLADLGLCYGETPRQYLDLFRPDAGDSEWGVSRWQRSAGPMGSGRPGGG